MFAIGGLLSALLFVEIFTIPEWLSVTVSFFSMLGGGVLCSALVSFLIEKQNSERDRKQKEEQRTYCLSAVKSGFERLCERELAQLSIYYTKYVIGNNEKWKREEISFEKVTDTICALLAGIENYEKKKAKEERELVITLETLEVDKSKKSMLALANKPCYDFLLNALERLSNDFPLYLSSGILSKQDVDTLNSLIVDLRDILIFSSEDTYDEGTIMVFKKDLFEKSKEIAVVLNIPANCVISCHHKSAII